MVYLGLVLIRMCAMFHVIRLAIIVCFFCLRRVLMDRDGIVLILKVILCFWLFLMFIFAVKEHGNHLRTAINYCSYGEDRNNDS